MTMYCNLFADFLKVQSFSVCLCFICFVDSLSIKSQPHTKKIVAMMKLHNLWITRQSDMRRDETRPDETRPDAMRWQCAIKRKIPYKQMDISFWTQKKTKKKNTKKSLIDTIELVDWWWKIWLVRTSCAIYRHAQLTLKVIKQLPSNGEKLNKYR